MLSRQFPTPVRERGQRYFREHRVRIRSGSAITLEAEVRGSESYFVRLTCSENRIGMACDCPFYFDRGLPCKHIWASILAADEQGYLSQASAIQQASAVVKPTVPPAWKTQLNRIALSAAPTKAEEMHWPAGMEIVYLVDIARSRGTGTVVLTVGRREPRNGGWNTPRPYLIDSSRVAKVPLAEDREILTMLTGQGPTTRLAFPR
jgi:SWIM zinc finger